MYRLTLDLVDFLLTPRAQAALAGLAPEAAESPRAVMALRREFTPEEAAALVEQAQLRHKAAAKFADAERLLFVDEALQQASSRAVAEYRARSFAGCARVADLGCGIGADTLALAEIVPQVLAVERDPVRARVAAANVAARGLTARVQVVCADWTGLALDVDAAFADPARRVDERRVFRLAAMEPPLAALLALRARVPALAVKVAPGVDHAEIPPEAEVEFISDGGTLKEALLRFGDLRRGAARMATRLPGPQHLDSNAPASEAAPRAPGAFLYEPDPAILRATLVRALALQLGAAQLDADIAYLTGDAYVPSPFARAWRVLRHGPFNLKALNRWLREMGAGDVVVKKRGSPLEPEQFKRRLKTTPGGPPVTVFLTHVQGKPWMILGDGVQT